jgi:putative tryptophan/tyrosine transport system substrate-binding protein
MRRREVIKLLGGTAAAWPLAAHAQREDVFRIACLGPGLDSPYPLTLYRAFVARLTELGFEDGRNLIVDYRGIEDPRGPFVLAAELLRAHPHLVVAFGPEIALQAVLGASAFIPVVFVAVNFDPLARGYVASLAHPDGNITGVVFQQLELAQKQVELLTEAFPKRTRLSVLYDAQSADQFTAAERTGQSLGLQVHQIKLQNLPYDFDAAFQQAQARAAQIVLVLSSPNFLSQVARIVQLSLDYRLPTMFINSNFVQAGGLLSYGADFAAMWLRSADYVGKILKGAKPNDLPVEQAVRFEMVVNLKTARAIGIELPTSILLRADKVIE